MQCHTCPQWCSFWEPPSSTFGVSSWPRYPPCLSSFLYPRRGSDKSQRSTRDHPDRASQGGTRLLAPSATTTTTAVCHTARNNGAPSPSERGLLLGPYYTQICMTQGGKKKLQHCVNKCPRNKLQALEFCHRLQDCEVEGKFEQKSRNIQSKMKAGGLGDVKCS